MYSRTGSVPSAHCADPQQIADQSHPEATHYLVSQSTSVLTGGWFNDKWLLLPLLSQLQQLGKTRYIGGLFMDSLSLTLTAMSCSYIPFALGDLFSGCGFCGPAVIIEAKLYSTNFAEATV